MVKFIKVFSNVVRYWYFLILLGLIFIFTGIYIMSTPDNTYDSLSGFFNLVFLVFGGIEIAFALLNRNALRGWGWFLISGIFTMFIGGYLLVNPGVSSFILSYVVGFILLFHAFQLLGFAIELHAFSALRWGNVGIMSLPGIGFSIVLISFPLHPGISVVMFSAMAFIFVGLSYITLAYSLRRLKRITKGIIPEDEEEE